MNDIYEWATNEVKFACENATDDYSIRCYLSALKAFKSLCEDGHSEDSIETTRKILNRLIDAYPLTQIENTKDVWKFIREERCGEKRFQCTRMASLFKTVYADGRCTYSDINRCRCKDISESGLYSSKESRDIVDRLFPITMPYNPSNHYIFLVDVIEDEYGRMIGTRYLKLFKNGIQVKNFKTICMLNGKEIDIDNWMRVKIDKDASTKKMLKFFVKPMSNKITKNEWMRLMDGLGVKGE